MGVANLRQVLSPDAVQDQTEEFFVVFEGAPSTGPIFVCHVFLDWFWSISQPM
jgi:hypothetical protein